MKNENEKYCNECAAVISKKAYICPHCGVKQSGINVDTEQIGNAVKVGSLTIFMLFIMFIRWVARTATGLAPIGGGIAAVYYYFDRGAYWHDDPNYWAGEYEFYTSIGVIVIVPIVGLFINSKATSFLKRLGVDEE